MIIKLWTRKHRAKVEYNKILSNVNNIKNTEQEKSKNRKLKRKK